MAFIIMVNEDELFVSLSSRLGNFGIALEGVIYVA